MDGKTSRMKKIFKSDGHSLIVAIDHGVALGPMTGIQDIKSTIKRLDATGMIDTWLLTKGIYKSAFFPKSCPGTILRMSGGATITGPDLANEGLTGKVEEALMLGADSVAVSTYIGSPFEHDTLINLAKTAQDTSLWNVPLLGIAGLGKSYEEKKQDAKFLALGARVIAEHGADMVKTYYTKKDFEKVVAGCPVPILIAGGPKCETDYETLDMIYGAIQEGAKGIVMGRNIWQSPHPEALLSAASGIIHNKLSINEAFELLKCKI
jgi:DhnA family fructose-bisphosphate aldolase class Ia